MSESAVDSVAVTTASESENDPPIELHSAASNTPQINKVVIEEESSTSTAASKDASLDGAAVDTQIEAITTIAASSLANIAVADNETNVTTTKSLDKDEAPLALEATSSTSKVDEESTPPAQLPAPSPTDSAATDDTYAEHVTYETDGSAIYTDPNTRYRYKWCTTANTWLPCNDAIKSNVDNPYENEHYKWCSETQQWIPKQTPNTQTTETEHYKWDAEKHEWVPKVAAIAAAQAPKDDNVTYSIDEDGQRIYTDKDGAVFFWDAAKNAWFPKIDDDFMARYQMNYGFIDNTSAAEEEKRKRDEEEAKLKELELQRMMEEAKAATVAAAATSEGSTAAAAGVKRKAQEPPKWFDMDPAQNTKVYVWNLPLDITLDEFADVMGKCGMIMRDPQTQKYKLKLYAEPDGQLKGDGLCDYIKVESVDLALNILDEYNLRGHKIRVQRAKFQMRGEYNPALKPKRKKKDKEKMQKMKERLFDWRPEKMRGERTKNEKVVILKNLFEPSIFEKEVQLILDYQNDLREECGKCGTVRKIIIYDRHPEGVAQVNMSAPEEADQVIQMMQGRFFGKRQLSADHWDGKTKYKVAESETEVQKRLNNWDQYLESEEEKKVANEKQTPSAAETAAKTKSPTAAENGEISSAAAESIND